MPNYFVCTALIPIVNAGCQLKKNEAVSGPITIQYLKVEGATIDLSESKADAQLTLTKKLKKTVEKCQKTVDYSQQMLTLH